MSRQELEQRQEDRGVERKQIDEAKLEQGSHFRVRDARIDSRGSEPAKQYVSQQPVEQSRAS